MAQSRLFCPLRKIWVIASPEEQIRQKLITYMVEELSYPLAYLVLEKELQQMPHLALKQQKLPTRRTDIVCFSRNIHSQYPLYPLLLIECKAVPITSGVWKQVIGYNHYLQAPFIAVVNASEIRFGWYDQMHKNYHSTAGLPPYPYLIQLLDKRVFY